MKDFRNWRAEVENKPGVLARTLESLAAAGADLRIVMGYRYARDEKAAIEVYPVTSKKSVAAAQTAGLGGSSIPSLLVEGDNKPGLAHAVAKAIGEAGINLGFLVASRRPMRATQRHSLRRPRRLGRSERSSGAKS